MRLSDLESGSSLVLGFGREGRALERAALTRAPSARVGVYCDRPPEDPPARWPLYDALEDAWRTAPSRVLRSPGVPLDHPLLARSRAAGIPVTCISSLWFGERPDAPVVAVTGSKGKSTTAALIAHLLAACGNDVALGGNIGIPMLDLLDTPADWYVVELSSYQLADLVGHATLGVITRLFPEHQDWHGGTDAYYAAKLRMMKLLDGGALYFNGRDDLLANRLDGRPEAIAANRPGGLHARADGLWRGNARVMRAREWGLPGRHNLDNAALALAVVESIAGRIDDPAALLASFRPLPHRLHRLGGPAGTVWIDDSISTTPFATLAALQAVDSPTVLIAGGLDRGADWSEVAAFCAARPLAGLVTLPDNGASVADILRTAGGVPADRVRPADDIEAAVELAGGLCPPGGTVLLSPGAPSFPRYRDFEERGERFEAAVEAAADAQ